MTYSYHDLRELLAAHGIPDADFDALTLLEAYTAAPRFLPIRRGNTKATR